MRTRLPALVLSLLLAAPVALSGGNGYAIYLKDGSQVIAREKPTKQGKSLVFYTMLGAMQTIPLSEYDEKKTLEMASLGTGGAYVLGDTPVEKEPQLERKPSLSEFIQKEKRGGIGEERKPVEVAKETRGGLNEPTVTTLDPQLESIFLHTLETYGIKAPRVSAAPAGVRVQGVAETEEQVFSALKGIAKSLADTRTSGRPVGKAEIWLSTSTGESAGHFEMSLEDADQLVGGKKSAAAWFMSNVIL